MICSLRLYQLYDMSASIKLQKQNIILGRWVQRRRALSDDGSGERGSIGACDHSPKLWSKKFPHSPAKL